MYSRERCGEAGSMHDEDLFPMLKMSELQRTGSRGRTGVCSYEGAQKQQCGVTFTYPIFDLSKQFIVRSDPLGR